MSTDGNGPSREIELLVPPSGVSGRSSRIPNQGVEHNMQDRSFRALGISAEVAAALERRDIVTPFPIQALVLPDALAGVDVLAKAPTGSGKTLGFALPIAARATEDDGKPSVLVIVPPLELVGKQKGLRAAAVYGGAPISSQAKRAREAHILIATPGRLQDLIERRLVSLDRVRTLVLDEADRMLDMGFKPQVDRLVRRVPKERQTMRCSATLDGEVGELARAYTRNPSRFAAEPPDGADQGVVEHKF